MCTATIDFATKQGKLNYPMTKAELSSAQRVPEPDPIPGISFDTQPDPIQF